MNPIQGALAAHLAQRLPRARLLRELTSHPTWHVPCDPAPDGSVSLRLMRGQGGEWWLLAFSDRERLERYHAENQLPGAEHHVVVKGSSLFRGMPGGVAGVAFDLGPEGVVCAEAEVPVLRRYGEALEVEAALLGTSTRPDPLAVLRGFEGYQLIRHRGSGQHVYVNDPTGRPGVAVFTTEDALEAFLATSPLQHDPYAERILVGGPELFGQLAPTASALVVNCAGPAPKAVEPAFSQAVMAASTAAPPAPAPPEAAPPPEPAPEALAASPPPAPAPPAPVSSAPLPLAVAPTIAPFLEHEAALRAFHGPESLYVRPKVYGVPAVPGAQIVIGGWGLLDGDPAMIPEGLHLLVIAEQAPDGSVVSYPRDPAAVLALLAPWVTRVEAPCAHLVARVPPERAAALRAQIAAMPEHDPVAAAQAAPPPGLAPVSPVSPDLVPVLKEAGWAHRELVVCMPFPGLHRPDAPLVAFAEDTPNGYSFLTRQAAPGADPAALLAPALANLQRRAADFVMMSPAIAVSGGRDLTAERLLDRAFLGALHQRLGPAMWVCVPHRVALYALATWAAPGDLAMFSQVVTFEQTSGPEKGHAPVSALAFRVHDGVVVGAVPLEALSRGEVPVG